MSLAPESETPPVVAAMPENFPDPGMAAEPYRPEGWWRGFEDPVLEELIGRADINNLDIAAARARVDAARAQARVERAAQLPQLNAGADAQYSDTPLAGSNFGSLAGGGGGVAVPDRLNNESYGLSLNLAYELDFWGRARNDARAARAAAEASAADLQTARLGVLAQVIATYFDLVDARASIALTLDTITVLADRLQRAEDRFSAGVGSSFELYQVRQDYRNAQSSLPQLESRASAAAARLATLVGTHAGTLDLDRRLTPRLIFTPVPAGLPAGLLAQRPDVAAAAYRYEAARYRLGARRAELFPSLRLNGTLGTQGSDPEAAFDIMDNWLLNLGAGLTAPLFQGGRISANIDAADAGLAEAAANYGQTFLTAYEEAVSAIEDYEEQRQRYVFLTQQVRDAARSRRLQAERYAAGVADYADYLDAQRSYLQAELARSGAGRAVALGRLAVYRALGGEWTAEMPGHEGQGG